MMSTKLILLILCHVVLNSVLSYIISGLNLLWSDRNYKTPGKRIPTDFWDSIVYPVGTTGFRLFFMQFIIMNTVWCTLHCWEGSVWSMTQNYNTVHSYSMHMKTLKCEQIKTSGQKQQITTYFENWRATNSAIMLPSRKQSKNSDTEKRNQQTNNRWSGGVVLAWTME